MKKTLLTMTTLFLTTTAWAGGNHFHPKQIVKCGGECTPEQIKGALPEAIPYLNTWKRIDLSWAKAKVEAVEKKQFKKGPEWMVTLVDSTPEKNKRYVFFTLDGYVTGSNSTGQ